MAPSVWWSRAISRRICEVGERLVEEEHRRLPHDRPAEGDALLLAAGELLGPVVEQRVDPQDARRFPHPGGDLVLRDAAQLEAERQVLEYRHVRVQRVILEHHRDVAVPGRNVVHHPVADAQLAGGDRLEPGHHPQGRALAAAGGPDENDELTVLDGQVQIGDRDAGAARVLVYFADAAEGHACHEGP